MPTFFNSKKRKSLKVILVQKTSQEKPRSTKNLVTCQELQENPKILPRNPGKPKNKRGKSGRSQGSRLQPSPPPRNPNHKNSGRKSKIIENKIYKHPKVDYIVIGYGF